MKRYRSVLDHIGSYSDIPYYRIEVDDGNGFKRLEHNVTRQGKDTISLIEQIIENEREWVKIPVEISTRRI